MTTKKKDNYNYYYIIFSPCIERGKLKECYNVLRLTPVPQSEIDSKSDSEQIKISDEDKLKIDGKSLVMLQVITRHDEINAEIKLQQKFSNHGLAPYITNTFRYIGTESFLAVNCGTILDKWGVEKLFLHDDDDDEFMGFIYLNRLIALFSKVYDLNYIFVDSSPKNICYDTYSKKFQLIDFEPLNCYEHKNLITKKMAIKYNLWILFSYFLINTKITHSKLIEYLANLESFSDTNLGIDSRDRNLGLQMDRKIGKIGDGGILDELIAQNKVLKKYGNTLSDTFLYYSLAFDNPKYLEIHERGLLTSDFLLMEFTNYSNLTLKKFIIHRYRKKIQYQDLD